MAKLREDYEEKLKWNVKDLFASEDDYLKMVDELSSSLEKFKVFKGKLLSSAKTLYDFLSFDNNFNSNLEQVYIYAHIQNDQDTTNTKYQAMYGKAYKLYERYNEETAFVIQNY